MIGLGVVINVVGIITAGAMGLAGGRFITPRMQDTLMKVVGVHVLFVGMAGLLAGMLSVEDGKLVSGQAAMVVCLFAVGFVEGELIDLHARFENLGTWLRDKKTGSGGDVSFVNGFVTAPLTVRSGAMAIVGPTQDGLLGDCCTPALKGALDALIVCVMTAWLGRGCIFSVLFVGVLQGIVTALSTVMEPIMTPAALGDLSLVGFMLIFCVGMNLIWKGAFKTANKPLAVIVDVA